MKNLVKYMKRHSKECVLAPLFKLFEAVFDLLVPLVVAAIIDYGIGGDGGKDYILKMSAILALLAVAGLIMATAAQYFAAKAAVGFAADIKIALFNKIQSMSYSKLDEIGTSTIITRMTSDVNQLQTGVNLGLRLFLRAPVIVFGATVMAFTVDASAAVVFVVVIPLLFATVFGIMALTVPLYRKAQSGTEKLLGKTRENLTGVRVIRAFANEENAVSEFDFENESLTKVQKFVGKASSLLNPLTFFIVNAALIAIIYIGSLRVDGGFILKGSVVALYSYMAQILAELIKFANLIITTSKSVASGKRINDVLLSPDDDIPAVKEAPNISDINSDIAVLFDDVSFGYGGNADALSDISFSAERGEKIGIIGGTGSGKTTLVNLIAGFYRANEGKIYVDGVSVNDYAEGDLLKKIGIVPQKAVLFAGTVRENMKWGKPDATDGEILTAVKAAQAYDVIEKKGGLDCRVEQDAKNFSGGQRQRLTIARALVKKPDILILDDSASALDHATEAALRRAVSKLDATVFIVSQRASSVMFANKIIVLEDGAVAGMGSHEQLMQSCETYREIYFSQYPDERGTHA